MQYSRQFMETLDGTEHAILVEDDAPGLMQPPQPFSHAGNCLYNTSGLACTVPAGPLFHDGRQSRQFERQPGLGVRA